MAFTGHEEHGINLADAIRFTATYREENGTDFLGAFFGKEAMEKILNQQGCVGIRIYNAVDDNNKGTFVLVGVTAENNDITEGELAEFSTGCPPNCPLNSPLVGAI